MRCYEAVKLFRDRIPPSLGADALQDVCIYIYKLWRGGFFVIRIASSFFISSTGSLCIFFSISSLIVRLRFLDFSIVLI